ncbi:MAG: bifunctional alpha,alpha-trehalose-phosphate synthase (UDP-forming)/trehalose-phosphatase [Acidobacteria bacterium]|nr:MAG: bifunctional alpha,alpha-trehalose-phosphate synthase (UDP-forming)/trehalose-phosphatase [Acidobacteriota bacterium]
MPDRRLIVVSTRLPVSLTRTERGWRVQQSPGGLATALRALADRRGFTWVGWPGAPVPPEDRGKIADRLARSGRTVPVFIDERLLHGFYEEFSNRLLWPLFHGMTDRARYDRRAWHEYREVNEAFADVVAEIARPGDAIWIHDYQLALLPQMLRERRHTGPIGFFLHIPFPSAEIYRRLPVREPILRGMLGADLVGFHTYEYISHFRNACLRVLGLESDPETVHMPTHSTRLGVLPIGIDPAEVVRLAGTDEGRREYDSLRRRFAGKKLIVGVDRLDYTKGIPEKLRAYDELLRTRPEWKGRAVLVQVAAPSRTGVQEYQDLKREVDELVGSINGEHGTVQWTPLVYVNRNVSRARIAALFRAADVAFVTPLRDGMNLVCLEYIAAREGRPGQLVLSEFAGAASCLAGARLVNPHNVVGMAEVLADALASDPDEETFGQMADFVRRNTAARWAERFLARMETSHVELNQGPRYLQPDLIVEAAAGRGRPLFLLDYDGTLEPHAMLPAQAAPGERLLRLLRRLAEVATVYVVSGRPAPVLEGWLGDLPIGLVSEHGLRTRPPGGTWPDRPTIDHTVIDELVRPVFEDFVERTPGSKIETKEASIAWHYRAADPRLGAWRATELLAVLEERLRGREFSVLPGSRVIEVRHALASKARVVGEALERHPGTGLLFCAGNDRTDEEMFEAAQRGPHEPVMTCCVGRRQTIAQFFVESPGRLLDQLESFVASMERVADPTGRLPSGTSSPRERGRTP